MDGGGGRQNTPLCLVATSRSVQESQKSSKSNTRSDKKQKNSNNKNKKAFKTGQAWRRRREAGGDKAEAEGASMVRVAARALDDAIVQMSKVSNGQRDVMRAVCLKRCHLTSYGDCLGVSPSLPRVGRVDKAISITTSRDGSSTWRGR